MTWQNKVKGVTKLTSQLSNGYSASRYPLNGDISIHYNTSNSVEKLKLLFC